MSNTNLTRFVHQRMERYGKIDLCPVDGDIPVLQFVNTVQHRGTAKRKDHLETYDDFLSWCYEIGLIDQNDQLTLENECLCYVDEAASIANLVLVTRETLYELICCIAADVPVHPTTLNDFNAISKEATRHLLFEVTPAGFTEVWTGTDKEMAFPLWKMVKHAADFLSSGDFRFIKKCCCGNLFLDKTKNKIRQYCNPLTCGRVQRATRYYQLKIAGK